MLMGAILAIDCSVKRKWRIVTATLLCYGQYVSVVLYKKLDIINEI